MQIAFSRTAHGYDTIADGLLPELIRGIPAAKVTRWLQRAGTELLGDVRAPSVELEQQPRASA